MPSADSNNKFNKIDYGFESLTSLPIDRRLVLNKREMLNASEGFMPDVYLTVCKEDGKLYIYNITNSVDPITGKFRELEAGGGSASWGDIQGTLSSQVDLQDALDLKFNSSEFAATVAPYIPTKTSDLANDGPDGSHPYLTTHQPLTDYATLTYVNGHINDTTVHVTAADKTNWNAKQNALTAGTNITLSENTISAPQNVSAFINDKNYVTDSELAHELVPYATVDALKLHTSEGAIHVSVADRTNWNNKQEKIQAGDHIIISEGKIISVEWPEFKHVKSNWNETNESSEGFIKNKPAVWPGQSGTNAVIIGNSSNSTSANYALAEGWGTAAYNRAAHAEGRGTTAQGDYSHAEGYNTKTWAQAAHAEGEGTMARVANQHVQGKFNADNASAVDIVGWGTDASHKKNLSTLHNTGDLHLYGDIYIGADSEGNGGIKLINYTAGTNITITSEGVITPCELPNITSADAGKVLMVNSEGRWETSLPQDSGTIRIFKLADRGGEPSPDYPYDPINLSDYNLSYGTMAAAFEIITLDNEHVSYSQMKSYIDNGDTILVSNGSYYMKPIKSVTSVDIEGSNPLLTANAIAFYKPFMYYNLKKSKTEVLGIDDTNYVYFYDWHDFNSDTDRLVSVIINKPTIDSPIKVLKTLDRRYTDYALVADVENKLGIPSGDLAELYELVDLNGNSISYYDAVNYLNKGGTLVVKYSGLLYYLYDIGPKQIISGWPATVRDCIGNDEVVESNGLHYFNWSFNGNRLLYISY